MLLRCAVIALAALIGTVLGDPTYVHPEGTPLFAKFSGEDPRGHGVNVEHCNDVHVIHLQDIGYPGVTVEQMVAPYQYAMVSGYVVLPWVYIAEKLTTRVLWVGKYVVQYSKTRVDVVNVLLFPCSQTFPVQVRLQTCFKISKCG